MAPILQTELGRFNAITDQRNYGRRYAPDPRDRGHTMERALAAMKSVKGALARRTQAPRRGPTLDQDITPKCVMFSAATALGAAPVTYSRNPLKIVQQPIKESANDAWMDLYDWAQAHDEWPGVDYEGTSVRAGQEYLRLIGRSSGYVWARNLAEAKDYIGRVGSAPIILGIDWLEQMSEPELVKGAYYLKVGGPVVGGHAICCLWFDKPKKAWKLQNTWGEGWGDRGVAYLRDEDFDYLVFQANGEACSFVEPKL